jgi:hypothetical protein
MMPEAATPIQKDIVAGDLPGVNLVGQHPADKMVDTPTAPAPQMAMAAPGGEALDGPAPAAADGLPCPNCGTIMGRGDPGWLTCGNCGKTAYSTPDSKLVKAGEAPAYSKMVPAAGGGALAKALPGGHFDFFVPLSKVDAARREVWGYATVEEGDHTGQIMDYESSLPHFEKWSADTMQRSGGKSLGNVREMHNPVAAGKLVEFKPDGARKGFWVGAKVVDEQSWQKVEDGVLTGFSVGGDYGKVWRDRMNPRLERYTALPSEVSLVDAPCVPSATFQMVKADGTTEPRLLKGAGLGEHHVIYSKAWPTLPPESPRDAQGVSVEVPAAPMSPVEVKVGTANPTGTVDVTSPTSAGQVAAADAPQSLAAQATPMLTATSSMKKDDAPKVVKVVRRAKMVKVHP